MILLACADSRWGIGSGGRRPVTVPEDIRRFQAVTEGGAVIFGRRAAASLPQGLFLDNCRRIVLSRREETALRGWQRAGSVEEALRMTADLPSDKVFAAGGESVYRALLPFCDKALITRLDYRYACDAYMPDLDREEGWALVEESDEKTYFDIIYTFCVYQRTL